MYKVRFCLPKHSEIYDNGNCFGVFDDLDVHELTFVSKHISLIALFLGANFKKKK